MTDDGLLLALAMTAKRVLEEPNAANRVALKMNVDEALKRVKSDTRAGKDDDQKRQKRAAKKAMREAATHRDMLLAGWEGGLTPAEIGKEIGKAGRIIERQLVAMQIADAGEIQRRAE